MKCFFFTLVVVIFIRRLDSSFRYLAISGKTANKTSIIAKPYHKQINQGLSCLNIVTLPPFFLKGEKGFISFTSVKRYISPIIASICQIYTHQRLDFELSE